MKYDERYNKLINSIEGFLLYAKKNWQSKSKAILFTIAVLISLTAKVNSQWYPLQYNVGTVVIDIDFVNVNTGFVAGYNIFLKTSNGGVNWNINPDFNQYHLKEVYFKNQNTGFTVSFDTIHSSLFRTTDCGESWHNINAPDFSNPESILFLNEQTGFVFGRKVIILKTTNGGSNWFHAYPSYTLDNSYINGSARVNDSTFVGVGTYKLNPQSQSSRAIYYSNDAGQTLSLTVIWENNRLEDVSFNNSGTGIVVGGGYISRSTNFGVNWTAGSTSNWGSDVCFTNETTVYKVKNSIEVSTDAGLNWLTQYPGGVKKVEMINTNTGYALGINGVILKTINGGFTKINNISTEIPSAYSLSQNYPNPFNPTTTIKFDVAKNKTATIIIFDMLGKEVETLVNEHLDAGTYTVDWNATDFPSGIYFYRLQIDGFTETKRMILLK